MAAVPHFPSCEELFSGSKLPHSTRWVAGAKGSAAHLAPVRAPQVNWVDAARRAHTDERPRVDDRTGHRPRSFVRGMREDAILDERHLATGATEGADGKEQRQELHRIFFQACFVHTIATALAGKPETGFRCRAVPSKLQVIFGATPA